MWSLTTLLCDMNELQLVGIGPAKSLPFATFYCILISLHSLYLYGRLTDWCLCCICKWGLHFRRGLADLSYLLGLALLLVKLCDGPMFYTFKYLKNLRQQKGFDLKEKQRHLLLNHYSAKNFRLSMVVLIYPNHIRIAIYSAQNNHYTSCQIRNLSHGNPNNWEV